MNRAYPLFIWKVTWKQDSPYEISPFSSVVANIANNLNNNNNNQNDNNLNYVHQQNNNLNMNQNIVNQEQHHSIFWLILLFFLLRVYSFNNFFTHNRFNLGLRWLNLNNWVIIFIKIILWNLCILYSGKKHKKILKIFSVFLLKLKPMNEKIYH